MNQPTAEIAMRKHVRLSSYPTAQPGGEAAGSQLAKRTAGTDRRSSQPGNINELTLEERQAAVSQPLQFEGKAPGREPSKTKLATQEHSPDAHEEEQRGGAE